MSDKPKNYIDTDKKSTLQPILIRSVATLVIVGILTFIYFQYGDIIFNQIHDIDQEAEHSMSGVDGIKIKSTFSDIQVFTADYDDFYARFTGRIKSPSKDAVPLLKASLEGSILTVEITYDNKDIQAMEDMQFNVYIPTDYHDRLEVLTSEGRIELPALELTELNCVSTTGDISTKSISVDAVVLSTINGKIDTTLTLEKTESVTIDTVSGHVNSDYTQALNTNYKFLTTTGDIAVKSK